MTYQKCKLDLLGSAQGALCTLGTRVEVALTETFNINLTSSHSRHSCAIRILNSIETESLVSLLFYQVATFMLLQCQLILHEQGQLWQWLLGVLNCWRLSQDYFCNFFYKPPSPTYCQQSIPWQNLHQAEQAGPLARFLVLVYEYQQPQLEVHIFHLFSIRKTSRIFWSTSPHHNHMLLGSALSLCGGVSWGKAGPPDWSYGNMHI